MINIYFDSSRASMVMSWGLCWLRDISLVRTLDLDEFGTNDMNKSSGEEKKWDLLNADSDLFHLNKHRYVDRNQRQI